MVELLDEVDQPNAGLLVDFWNLWDTPDVLTHIRANASRTLGVHVNDWRDPTRSWCDRVLPGDGIIDIPGMLRALQEGGFDGWYELEVMSDDGRNGNRWPDSLWERDPVELIRTAREQFAELWRASRDVAPAS
jgi:sugar phosphate isomerase/epimerase